MVLSSTRNTKDASRRCKGQNFRISWRTRDFHFEKAVKPPTVAYSDTASRPVFRSRINVFSTPSSTLETPSSWPLRHPSTPLQPASDRLVSRSYPVISGVITIDTPRKPCCDPHRDVDIVVADAILSTPDVVKRVLNTVPGGPYILRFSIQEQDPAKIPETKVSE